MMKNYATLFLSQPLGLMTSLFDIVNHRREKMVPLKVRPELQAVEDLRGYDHAFLSADGVAKFAKAFGLEGKIQPYLAKADPPGTIKGLTFHDGAKEARGMDAQDLAMAICWQLDVKFDSKFGRGSQLRACCDALEQHFSK